MYLNLYKKHLSYILQFDAYVKNVSCISQEHLIAEDMKKNVTKAPRFSIPGDTIRLKKPYSKEWPSMVFKRRKMIDFMNFS